MILSWGAKVSEEFCNKVISICQELFPFPTAPNDLMACMAFETGETFRADIKNAAGSGAVGLIQFMPDTAISLGTTTDLLAQMTPEDQLTYVRAYLFPEARSVHSLADMYMAILMPRYITSPNDTVVFRKGTIAYSENQGLDTDGDGRVTKGEICARLYAKRQEGLLPINSRTINI